MLSINSYNKILKYMKIQRCRLCVVLSVIRMHTHTAVMLSLRQLR